MINNVDNVDNFVEETLIISTMWKATWDIFRNKVSTIGIFHIVEIEMYTFN